MKKNTLTALYNYLNGDTSIDLTEARADITAEYEKQANASKAKAEAYEVAKPIVLSAIKDEAKTGKEIVEIVGDTLPDGFGTAKVQYGLLHYWMADVTKIPGEGKAPNTYKAR